MEVPFLQEREDYRLFSPLIKQNRIVNRGYEFFIDNINDYFNILLTSSRRDVGLVRHIMYQLSDFCSI